MGPIGGSESNGNSHTHGKDENVAELCDKILQNLSNAFERDDLL